jgi:phage/plasmid-like protein (TIGR03299 family)
MILYGFAEKRGRNAWWYDPQLDAELTESTHYQGAIPIDDVKRRLFSWHAVKGEIAATAILPTGVLSSLPTKFVAVMRDDTGEILSIPTKAWEPHQYDEWLVDALGDLLDDSSLGLGIGSAAVFNGGRLAFVSIDVPDNIVTPEGVKFRPHILATTCMDQTIKSTYNSCITNCECDNTHGAGLAEGQGHSYKVKHTKNSEFKALDGREAIGIIYEAADDFKAEVAGLCATTVTNKQWSQYLDIKIPVKEDATDRSKTIAANKRAIIEGLWRNDPRVAPWANTAWGVVQAVNTAETHEWSVKGDRRERNLNKIIKGEFADLDAETASVLSQVLATA